MLSLNSGPSNLSKVSPVSDVPPFPTGSGVSETKENNVKSKKNISNSKSIGFEN